MAFVILVSKVDKITKLDKSGPTFLVPLPNVLNEDKMQVMYMLDYSKIPRDVEHRLIHTDELEDVTMEDLEESLWKIRRKAEECTAFKKSF